LAGKIIADIIEAPAGRISLNVANVTVASINALGLFTSTGNLLITQANSIATAAIEDGAVTNAKLSLVANASNIKTALNASGDAPIFACRAWVNFNGTGTVAIRASGNVSSITDNGTGDYTVNFTTTFPDSSFACVATYGNTAAQPGSTRQVFWTGSRTSSSVRLFGGTGATPNDETDAQVAIFR
jgi:hypothetical protein